MSQESRSGSATAVLDGGAERGRHLAGKYLTFNLGGETYGLEILKVQEIMGLMDVTRVPMTPEFVRGVINLRGKIIPVIELRCKFAMQSVEDTEKTCIIVMQLAGDAQGVTTGIIVDEVSEVMDLAVGQIEDTPSFGQGVHTDFILGVGKIEDKVVMLLDVDRVLTSEEIAAVRAVRAGVPEGCPLGENEPGE